MKRLILSALAASALITAIAPTLASAAAPWTPINARQSSLDQRIDLGVRNGALTQAEAVTLRAEFRRIAALEATYRSNGLSAAEQADLNRRMNLLSARVYINKHDAQTQAGWQSINARQAVLYARIEQGVKNGALTRAESLSLRSEFLRIAALEATYRRSGGGLTAAERSDLDRRMDVLQAEVFINKHDLQHR